MWRIATPRCRNIATTSIDRAFLCASHTLGYMAGSMRADAIESSHVAENGLLMVQEAMILKSLRQRLAAPA